MSVSHSYNYLLVKPTHLPEDEAECSSSTVLALPKIQMTCGGSSRVNLQWDHHGLILKKDTDNLQWGEGYLYII